MTDGPGPLSVRARLCKLLRPGRQSDAKSSLYSNGAVSATHRPTARSAAALRAPGVTGQHALRLREHVALFVFEIFSASSTIRLAVLFAISRQFVVCRVARGTTSSAKPEGPWSHYTTTGAKMEESQPEQPVATLPDDTAASPSADLQYSVDALCVQQ